MMSDRQLWCADTTLTLAIQMAAQERSEDEQTLFRLIVESPVYDALYDESTDLWAMGPAYLLDFCRSCGIEI